MLRGHWKSAAFTGTPRLADMAAPFVYNGDVGGNVFLAYVEQDGAEPVGG